MKANRIPNPLIWGAVGAAIGFWLVESFVHSVILGLESFSAALVTTQPNELWMRFLVIVLILLLGVSSQIALDRQRQAMERLRERKERFRLLVDSLPVLISYVDADQRYRFNNRRYEEWFGHAHDEIYGRRVIDVLGEAAYDTIRGHIESVLAGEPVEFETMVPYGDADSRWVRATYAPHVADDGQVKGYYALAIDITARKRAEEALERSVAELERSNEELEQFAYVASHDLQEPLRMVSSYVQLLAQRYQGKLDSDADDFIGFAVDGANRMKDLIDGLLIFSRTGTRDKPPEAVDGEAVLARVLTDLGKAVEETGATITHDPLPKVVADETRFAQVFQNLIANALRFRGDAPPRIHVSARRQDRFWAFSVRDNGIGIAPEHRERVFEIFQRLHGRGEYAGSGIGLAIAKRIVERDGGRIWVESAPGEGSTFVFTVAAERGTDG